MAKHPKRPRDFAQLGKLIVEIATGQAQDAPVPLESPKAVIGRRGGLKGGKARAKKLSRGTRAAIAKKAAQARWKKKS